MIELANVAVYVALANLAITVGGGLIAFGAIKAKIDYQGQIMDRIERGFDMRLNRNERELDDLRRGKAWIIDDKRKTVNGEYGPG